MSDYEDNDNGKFDLDTVKAAIGVIVAVPAAIAAVKEILQSKISLPNFPCRVAKWGMWDTICEYGGWRLEQNVFTKHCRIVDPEGRRRAWGTKNGMIEALEEVNKRFSKS